MRWVLQPTRLVLLLCAVAVLIVPALRGEFVWNVRALAAAIPHWPKSPYAGCLGTDLWEAPAIWPYDAGRLLDDYPGDVRLRIGIIAGDVGSTFPGPARSSATRAANEAVRLAPHDREVLAAVALHWCLRRTAGFTRKEEGGGPRASRREPAPAWKERFLTAREVGGPLRALDAWAAADLDNAAPDALAAWMLLGAKKDKDALLRAEAGARKRFFTYYDARLQEADIHAERLRGVPLADADARAITFSTMMNVNSRLRRFAYIMTGVGWDHYDSGDRETAFRYWLAMGRLGTLLMAGERESLITRVSAHAMQSCGYNAIYKRVKGKSACCDIRPGKAHAEFIALRGLAAAEQVKSEVEDGEAFCRRLRSLERALDSEGKLLVRLMEVYDYGRKAGMLAMLGIVSAALLAGVARGVSRQRPPVLRRVWSGLIVVGGVALMAGWFVMWQVADAWTLHEMRFGFMLPIGFGCGGTVLAVALLAIAAGWLSRKKGMRFRDALGGGMRQTMPTLLAALVVVWVVATGAAAYTGGRAVVFGARERKVGQLRMLEEFAREHGIRIERAPQ